jgi:hypothetical protein
MSLHFNANKFQDFIFETLKSKVNIIDQNVLPQDLKSDYIIDCSGRPQINDEFEIAKYIPVNSAYIRQCSWDYPQFNSTLAIARPYGWVFGIPLKSRCSIGYLFNSDITTIDEINEDWEHILHDYNLVLTDPETGKEKIVGYYTQLNNALKCVVKNQTIEKKPTYTIKEYITELETTLTNLKNLINHE